MRRTIHDLEIKNMLRLANDAMDRAYAPYSQQRVGACIKGASGAYYLGCNIENSSYAATECAERLAIFKGITEAERSFEAMSIVSSSAQITIPCGICRQVFAELCDPDMPVICANRNGKYQIHYVGDLIPLAFRVGDKQ